MCGCVVSWLGVQLPECTSALGLCSSSCQCVQVFPLRRGGGGGGNTKEKRLFKEVIFLLYIYKLIESEEEEEEEEEEDSALYMNGCMLTMNDK